MAERQLRKRTITGLRVFRTWLKVLPRNVYPTDLDFVLHNRVGNRMLVLEFKQPGTNPEPGQQEVLDALADNLNNPIDFTVRTVYEDSDPVALNIKVHDWFGWK